MVVRHGAFRDDLCTTLSQLLLVGFGIVVEGATNEALAVANKPHLATQSAEDYARGSESLLRVLQKVLQL